MDQYTQVLMTVGVPTLAVLTGILINNSRLGDLRSYIDTRFSDLEQRFGDRFKDIDRRFDEVGRRFDEVDRQFRDVKELWRSELHRVEEILDARLKHLEEN
jgi:hypothetical protein